MYLVHGISITMTALAYQAYKYYLTDDAHFSARMEDALLTRHLFHIVNL